MADELVVLAIAGEVGYLGGCLIAAPEEVGTDMPSFWQPLNRDGGKIPVHPVSRQNEPARRRESQDIEELEQWRLSPSVDGRHGLLTFLVVPMLLGRTIHLFLRKE